MTASHGSGPGAGNGYAATDDPRAGCAAARRRALLRAGAVLVGAVTLAGAVGAAAPAEDTPLVAGNRPACVEVSAEARFRNYGYDHVVTLDNRCDRRAQCEVSTDVNPSPIRVGVPAKERVEVITFIGSPSTQFVPTVSCALTPEPGDSQPRKAPRDR